MTCEGERERERSTEDDNEEGMDGQEGTVSYKGLVSERWDGFYVFLITNVEVDVSGNDMQYRNIRRIC